MFIISKEGTTAIPLELVTAIRIDDSEGDCISVEVKSDGSWFTMATFTGDDTDANLAAAKNCLAEMVKTLNETIFSGGDEPF